MRWPTETRSYCRAGAIAAVCAPGRYLASWTLFVLSLALAFAPSLEAQQAKPTEYQVKAAYLYNFTLFVSWPNFSKSSGAPFGVCVLGKDPFGAVLDSTFSGETVDRQPIRIQRITDARDARPCRILFISRSEDKKLNDILSSLDDEEVLTVSDIPDFSQRGGMIQFVWEGDTVRFEVNLHAAKSAGLVLSSDLLKVAMSVQGTPSGF